VETQFHLYIYIKNLILKLSPESNHKMSVGQQIDKLKEIFIDSFEFDENGYAIFLFPG